MAKKMTQLARDMARWLETWSRAEAGMMLLKTAFRAGWRARGRADATTKAERAVIEAAKKWRRYASFEAIDALEEALDALAKKERAR